MIKYGDCFCHTREQMKVMKHCLVLKFKQTIYVQNRIVIIIMKAHTLDRALGHSRQVDKCFKATSNPGNITTLS